MLYDFAVATFFICVAVGMVAGAFNVVQCVAIWRRRPWAFAVGMKWIDEPAPPALVEAGKLDLATSNAQAFSTPDGVVLIMPWGRMPWIRRPRMLGRVVSCEGEVDSSHANLRLEARPQIGAVVMGIAWLFGVGAWGLIAVLSGVPWWVTPAIVVVLVAMAWVFRCLMRRAYRDMRQAVRELTREMDYRTR